MAKLAALIGGGLLVVVVCIFLGMLAFAAVRDLYDWASKTIRERNRPGSPEAIARYGEPVVSPDVV